MTTAKILVVEDEGIIAKDIQCRLRRMGFDVLSPVSTGNAAIQQAAENHPDLILMDIMLKGDMDGIQAATTIRERLDMPIIYLTANSDNQTVERAKATAPFGFLLKPFKDTDAEISIEMALYKHRFDNELRQKDEELSTILKCVGDAIIATDDHGAVTFMNSAGEELTGWSVENARGHDLEEVAHIVDATSREAFSTLVPADQLDVRRRNHSLLLGKDGSEPAIEHTSAPILDDKHGRLGSVIVLRDVTEREQAEAELLAHREKLTELVAERTKDLTETNEELKREISEHERTALALQKAKEVAEAAAQSKSDFLANMSHEIRTPMHGVLGLAELLLMSDLTEEQREYAEGVITSGDSLIAIIDDILDFSKIDAGKLRMEAISFNLEEVVHTVVQLLRPKAEEKGLELAVDYPTAALRNFIGDPNRINQIVSNVVGNAVKFTERGSVKVGIECRSKSGDQIEIRIRVEDTGIGIEHEVVEHMFDMFSQADTSSTRKYGGTGLGLAITRRLIELMGGSINVDSEVGKGTILTLNLVLSTESATQSRTANQISGEGTSTIPAEADKGTSSSMRGTPRILLVEDHVVNQKVACGFLETLGCAIDLATNGREAVAMTEATDYDLVLMDVQMPEMDGLTATAKIRERETTGHVPIVAMTARAMQGDREHCIEAGMDDYITKPLQLEVIRTILEGIGHTS